MVSYIPTITVSSPPPVQATMAGTISYEEFINSLGDYVYNITAIQIECISTLQILQPLGYSIFDGNGSVYNKAIIMTVDPYQYTASLIEDLGEGLVLNDKVTVNFNLLPRESVKLVMLTDQVGVTDGFDAIGAKSNDKRVIDPIGNLKLFKDYVKTL